MVLKMTYMKLTIEKTERTMSNMGGKSRQIANPTIVPLPVKSCHKNTWIPEYPCWNIRKKSPIWCGTSWKKMLKADDTAFFFSSVRSSILTYFEKRPNDEPVGRVVEKVVYQETQNRGFFLFFGFLVLRFGGFLGMAMGAFGHIEDLLVSLDEVVEHESENTRPAEILELLRARN